MVGVQNDCMVTRTDLETTRWELALADTILRMAGSALEFDILQKIQVLSDAGM